MQQRVIAYPAKFEWLEEDGEYLISFRDIQGVNTSGSDMQDAFEQAQDALAAMIASLLERDEEIAAPSAKRAGEVMVTVPEEEALKLLIHERMKALEITKRKAASMAGMDPSQFGKVIRPLHAAKVSTLRNILATLGLRTGVVAYDAPAEKRG